MFARWIMPSTAGATTLSNPISKNTPNSVPRMLPSPPRITQQSMITERLKSNASGPAVLVSAVAYRQPAVPANPQPRAKADSLTRAALMPMQVAASSSSRIAIQARPRRERSRLRSSRITSSNSPSAR